MKRLSVIIAIVLMMFMMIGCPTSYATAEGVLDAQNENDLIKASEDAKKTMQQYIDEYGSEAYGRTAFILSVVRIFSIPFGFLGVAISAIYQYTIGIRKLDTQEKGLYMMVSIITIVVICQILPLAFSIVVKFGRG